MVIYKIIRILNWCLKLTKFELIIMTFQFEVKSFMYMFICIVRKTDMQKIKTALFYHNEVKVFKFKSNEIH